VVTGVDFSQSRVAPFIYVAGLGWYTKPSFAVPTVPINSDGTFSANVTTGGLDSRATIFCAALVAANYTPPQANGSYRIPADLNSTAIDFVERYGATLQFAGRTWALKDAPLPVGPGQNHFSALSSDVWTDSAGLHLTLHAHDGYWWATEVTLLGDHLGYGTYWYHTNSRNDILDVNVTFGGGFTWDDYGDEVSSDLSHNREIDWGEDSRWGVVSAPTTQAIKQPFDYVPGNRHRFNLPDLSSSPVLSRIMIWKSDSIRFITLKGNYSPTDYPADAVVDDWTYAHSPASRQYVPVPGRERIHLNLWLNQTVNASAPSNGQSAEVVISDFSFAPLPDAPTIATQPQSQVMPVGANMTFATAANGTSPLSYQWKKGTTILVNAGNISGATSATLTLANVQLADAGSYAVTVTNPAGNVTSNAATLTVYAAVSAPPSQHVMPGSRVMLAIAVSGSGSPTYQWKFNGTAIPGATSATYTVANAQAGDMGFYSVTVSNSSGSVDSAVAILTVSGGSSRLGSLSTRGVADAGANALIPGIALRGAGSKRLLIRAVGPTLGAPSPSGFGVPGTLSDPLLDLIPFGVQTPVVSNDDWGTNSDPDELRRVTAALGAFPLIEGSKDAAVLSTVSTVVNTLYTVRIAPSGTAPSGIALAEMYDTEGATAPVKLVTVSTRGLTGPDAQVLISGFWILGDGPKQLLIRAVGPTLGGAPYNVPGVLADPQLGVFASVLPPGKSGAVVSNDNWGGTAELKAAFDQVGAFHLASDSSKDAALVVRLPPAGYTVQATGVGGATGNVLVEVYDMDP